MTVLFLGTPSFVIPVLEKLHEKYEVIGVVTQPDKPVGRKQILTPPPVKVRARELGLPVFQPIKITELLNVDQQSVTSNQQPDFLITASYGAYLPEEVLNMAKKDSLNTHPSLLPKYRGATPIQTALLNGDAETGVSIIRMVKKMDAGEIFAQEKFPIRNDILFPELIEHVFRVGAELLSKVLDNYDNLKPMKQDESKATTCTKIAKEDGLVDLVKDSPENIWNKFRAYQPWPGIFVVWKGKKVGLVEIGPPNPLARGDSTRAIEIKKVKLEGKKEMDFKAFLNGHPDFAFLKPRT